LKSGFPECEAVYYECEAVYYECEAVYCECEAVYCECEAVYYECEAVYYECEAVCYECEAVYYEFSSDVLCVAQILFVLFRCPTISNVTDGRMCLEVEKTARKVFVGCLKDYDGICLPS
jgi:hypothetical protein